ncbi:hypothetical protein Vadar_020036 [Vaccinium darrowii]|uniref:Uncharacterized protein n=1 Tax=Vaccinium darrowii TaxID=229202 RepID=A0ACB7ZDE3_9ERIC|nr:hypothetical protein Vadar_020036 [Vaccinium darrowii]
MSRKRRTKEEEKYLFACLTCFIQLQSIIVSVWIRIYHRACPSATGIASHISTTECPAVCQVYGWAMSDTRTCHPPNVCKQQSLGKGIRQTGHS